jgi:hypothetical protein
MAPSAWSPAAVRTVVALGVVTVVLIAAFVFVLWFHWYVAPIRQLRNFLHINGEVNLPTWWNATLLAAVAFCAFTARVQEHDVARRRAWLLVAVAGLLMSMDEITSLHERLNGLVLATGITPPTFPWLIPGVVIAAVGFLLLVRVGRALPRPARRLLLLALTGYAAGAIGMEAINGMLHGGQRLIYVMGTTVEEILEMSACILAVGTIINQLTTWAEATPLTARPGGGRSEPPGPLDQTPQQSPDHSPQPRRAKVLSQPK